MAPTYQPSTGEVETDRQVDLQGSLACHPSLLSPRPMRVCLKQTRLTAPEGLYPRLTMGFQTLLHTQGQTTHTHTHTLTGGDCQRWTLIYYDIHNLPSLNFNTLLKRGNVWSLSPITACYQKPFLIFLTSFIPEPSQRAREPESYLVICCSLSQNLSLTPCFNALPEGSIPRHNPMCSDGGLWTPTYPLPC